MNFSCPPFATDCEGAILIRILTEERVFGNRYMLWSVADMPHRKREKVSKP